MHASMPLLGCPAAKNMASTHRPGRQPRCHCIAQRLSGARPSFPSAYTLNGSSRCKRARCSPAAADGSAQIPTPDSARQTLQDFNKKEVKGLAQKEYLQDPNQRALIRTCIKVAFENPNPEVWSAAIGTVHVIRMQTHTRSARRWMLDMA